MIVPSSGGKDSGYVAHQLRFKYNMNPLTVTWAPLKYTDIGFKNLQASINSGLSNILCTPNGNFQRKKLDCVLRIRGCFSCFRIRSNSISFSHGLKLGVNLVFYGENGEAEYAGDPKYVDKPLNRQKSG